MYHLGKNVTVGELVAARDGGDANVITALETLTKRCEYLCSICFEGMVSDLSVTKCAHLFHKECLVKCLQDEKACPLCRAEINTDELGNF